jgi:topoisomerase-4 subunit A
MIYRDGQSGASFVKRFAVLGVTRDKEYDLTKGSKGSKMLYFTSNPNGEAEVVTVQLKPHSKLRKLQFDLDFSEIAIKGRSSIGNTVSKYPVKKIIFKSKGVSTLAGRKIWYDDILRRLNADGRGKYLGEFDGPDKILTVMGNGTYELTSFDLSNHFDDKMILIEKYDPEKVFTVVHIDGKSKLHYVKRFLFEDTPIGKVTGIINEDPGSKMVLISGAAQPVVKLESLKGKSLTPDITEVNLADAIDVKGMKAQGNRLTPNEVKTIELIAEHDDPEDVPDPVAEVPLEQIVKEEELEIQAEQDVSSSETIADKPKPIGKVDLIEEKAKPVKKIDFEITNPDDIEIDDKGQLGLF